MVEVIMNVKRLSEELRKCHDDTEIIIFAETEEDTDLLKIFL